MTERVATWIRCKQAEHDWRAACSRRARRLLDTLHGFATGRLVMRDGQVCPDRIIIPVSEAVDAFGRPKPVALGWFGSRPP